MNRVERRVLKAAMTYFRSIPQGNYAFRGLCVSPARYALLKACAKLANSK